MITLLEIQSIWMKQKKWWIIAEKSGSIITWLLKRKEPAFRFAVNLFYQYSLGSRKINSNQVHISRREMGFLSSLDWNWGWCSTSCVSLFIAASTPSFWRGVIVGQLGVLIFCLLLLLGAGLLGAAFDADLWCLPDVALFWSSITMDGWYIQYEHSDTVLLEVEEISQYCNEYRIQRCCVKFEGSRLLWAVSGVSFRTSQENRLESHYYQVKWGYQ